MSAAADPACVVLPDATACRADPPSSRGAVADEPDPLSAWATPPPLANAAPTPSVMAPAPSQDDTAKVRRSPRRPFAPAFAPIR
ncbi:hypothetical protein MMAD_18610 [Mycolicibacterium madagascariense]|uniref:Uncharacterized protein n=1 Tax=Mycolicibacterium madagascariense TaxID=212765 RepID=A0A7I7XD75_9MYCO|nr:hypothetical protein [Mycolicibacterium madagascariense]MCV7015273.1 hypothetical protein [Mycolicibacterium madagascariense]BBZ27566.1 hypothetical protein MMAD_18610 [Mycolicibacterium madagascariense]